jgi:hypothetical protein
MKYLDDHCAPGKCCICKFEHLCLGLDDNSFRLASKDAIDNRLSIFDSHYQTYEKALMRKTLDDMAIEELETKEKESMKNKEKTYKQGLEEAWEIARKVVGDTKHQDEYSSIDLNRIFGTDRRSRSHLLEDFPSIHEVKEKIAAYEAEQAKPKLGDVVNIDDVGLFLFLGENNTYYFALDPDDEDNEPHKFVKKYVEKIEKTGKHFDIQSMLDELKE